MVAIANFVATFIVFMASWGGIVQFLDPEIGRAGIYAFAIAGVTLAAGVHSWQPGGMLESKEPSDIAAYFSALFFGVLLFFLIDCLIVGVNPYDSTQWTNLTRSGGALGFIATVLLGVFGSTLFLATLIRAVVLGWLKDPR